MKSNEFAHSAQLSKFVLFVCKKLHINGQAPDIQFQQQREPDQTRTGHYNMGTNQLWVYTGNRNLVDIMRTVAHELAHHKQTQDQSITDAEALSAIESQADIAAGMIMKLYVKSNPEIIE